MRIARTGQSKRSSGRSSLTIELSAGMDTDSRTLAPRSVNAVLARKEGVTEKETDDQSSARANVAKRKACSSQV